MSAAKRWVDVIASSDEPPELIFIKQSTNRLLDKRGDPVGIDVAKLYLAGYLKDADTLRVYVGSYGNTGDSTRWTQVTIANCTPKQALHHERFGKAIFVGPVDEALDLFLAHARMMG